MGVRVPLRAPPWRVNRAGARLRLESGWHRKRCGNRATSPPPAWRVNRDGSRRRFEAGWCRKAWASTAPALRQMDGELGRLPALPRKQVAPQGVQVGTRRHPPDGARNSAGAGAGLLNPAHLTVLVSSTSRSAAAPARWSCNPLVWGRLSVRSRRAAPVHGQGKTVAPSGGL